MDEEQKITITLGEWRAAVEKAARLDERRELDEKIAKMIEVIKPLLPQLFPGAFPQPATAAAAFIPVPPLPYSDPIEELKKALVEIKDEIAELKPKEEPPKVDEKAANEKVGKVLRSLEKP